MNSATAMPAPDSAADIEAALESVVAQVKEIREQMKADDAAIARIKSENAALKAEGEVLKAETHAILAETRTILANLKIAA